MSRLDRRALFTSGAAAALLAAAGISPEARPRRGGKLRLAVSRDSGALERVANGAVYDTLTEVAPDGVLRGELASGWQGSGDAKVWEFALRDGVRFHDGAGFGAADVVASLEARMDALGVVRTEAVAPLRLRLELAEGNPHLPFHLSDATVRGADGSGTGLYAPVRMQEGRHFLGERVAGHYKDGQAGWVDAVDVIVIPDAGVRAEALRDGFVDVAELPAAGGLIGRGDFVYHPSAEDIAIAARRHVGIPRTVGTRAALDDGRIAERWWMV